MRHLLIPATLLALAAPVAAQEPVVAGYDPEVLNACISARFGTGVSACAGVAAEYCTLQDNGSGEEEAMLDCYGAEIAQWDRELADRYKGLIDLTDDAYPAEMSSLQDSFALWRNDACDYDGAYYAAVIGSGLATAQCRLNMTAAEAERLTELLNAPPSGEGGM